MNKKEKKLDLIIIGCGPAGLTAAIYASRLKLDMVVLEDEIIGGQIRGAYEIENYPGFINVKGLDLSDKMYEQATKLGAKIDEFDNIILVKLTDDEKIIETENVIYKPTAVIIATGSKHRELPIPEEKKFHGNGIHYCELCDGQMYEGKDILVVGGGNSAVEAAIFLSRYGNKITLIHKYDYLKADKSNQEELYANTKINIISNSKVQNALGEHKLEGVVIENLKTKDITNLKVDGVFVYIGLLPKTHLFKDYLRLNEFAYIEAGETTETNIKGVFAAGDVREKMFRQITTATADGTVAALMAQKYLLERRK